MTVFRKTSGINFVAQICSRYRSASTIELQKLHCM